MLSANVQAPRYIVQKARWSMQSWYTDGVFHYMIHSSSGFTERKQLLSSFFPLLITEISRWDTTHVFEEWSHSNRVLFCCRLSKQTWEQVLVDRYCHSAIQLCYFNCLLFILLQHSLRNTSMKMRMNSFLSNEDVELLATQTAYKHTDDHFPLWPTKSVKKNRPLGFPLYLLMLPHTHTKQGLLLDHKYWNIILTILFVGVLSVWAGVWMLAFRQPWARCKLFCFHFSPYYILCPRNLLFLTSVSWEKSICYSLIKVAVEQVNLVGRFCLCLAFSSNLMLRRCRWGQIDAYFKVQAYQVSSPTLTTWRNKLFLSFAVC